MRAKRAPRSEPTVLPRDMNALPIRAVPQIPPGGPGVAPRSPMLVACSTGRVSHQPGAKARWPEAKAPKLVRPTPMEFGRSTCGRARYKQGSGSATGRWCRTSPTLWLSTDAETRTSAAWKAGPMRSKALERDVRGCTRLGRRGHDPDAGGTPTWLRSGRQLRWRRLAVD